MTTPHGYPEPEGPLILSRVEGSSGGCPRNDHPSWLPDATPPPNPLSFRGPARNLWHSPHFSLKFALHLRTKEVAEGFLQPKVISKNAVHFSI